MIKRFGLRSKLLLSILPIVLIIIVGSGFWNYRTSTNGMMDQQIKDMEIIVQELDIALDNWMENRKREVVILSENVDFKKACLGESPEVVQTKLTRVKEIFPFYDSLWLADPNGSIFIDSSNGKTTDLDVSDESEYRKNITTAGKARSGFGEIRKSPVSGRPVVLFTNPIKSNGEIIGIIGAWIEVADFSTTFLGKVKFGRKGYGYLADSNGAIIAHPNESYIFNLDLNDYDFGQEIRSRRSGHLFYEWEGDLKIAFFKQNQKSGWVSVIAPLPEEFLGPMVKIKYQTFFVGFIAFLVVLTAAWFFVGWVTKTLKGVTHSLEAVSQGDLSERLELKSSDEIGDLVHFLGVMIDSLETKVNLADKIAAGDISDEAAPASKNDKLGMALQKMVDSLNDLIGQIHESAGQVATGADQIADSSQSLSQGATEQAASLEETTASLAEINSKTKTNAETTEQAVVLAENVKQLAEEGLGQMKQMVTAMAEMSEGGRRISGIIKVIDDIAFQTNLLALNAAVEAARAGQHGKGFAVVAQEVRHLAGRSAKAAGETNQLIAQALQKMENGDETVHQTAQSLTEIVEGIGKVSAIVEEIAGANRDQADGIAEINHGLGQIEQVTQHNSAAAEQAASAAEELSAQADHLNRLVAQFKMKSDISHAAQAVGTDFRAIVFAENQGMFEKESGNGRVRIQAPNHMIPYDHEEYKKH